MPVATCGSARLSYDVHGAGAPVLLLHAGVTDRRSWNPLIEHLPAGLRLIALDQRGAGTTTYRAEPHNPLDDVLAVLDAESVTGAIVVGASNGGRIALDLALAHPDRVRALVLIGAGVTGMPQDDTVLPAVQALFDEYDEAEEAGDRSALNRIEAHAHLDGWGAPEGRVQGPARELFLDMNGRILAAPDTGPEVEHAPAWGRLQEIEVPTLVLVGDLDEPNVPTSRTIAKTLPKSRISILPGTAHLPHLEGDKQCLRQISDFIGEFSDATGTLV